MDVIIGTFMIIVSAALFGYIAVAIMMERKQNPTDIADQNVSDQLTLDNYGSFPPIKPTNNSREAQRAFKRENQKYLMDMWEQRFEQEVGADEYRVAHLIAIEDTRRIPDYIRQYKAALSYEYARNPRRKYDGTYSAFPYDAYESADAENEKEVRIAKLEEQEKPKLLKAQQLVRETQGTYNNLMQRSSNAPIPTYKYKAFRG